MSNRVTLWESFLIALKIVAVGLSIMFAVAAIIAIVFQGLVVIVGVQAAGLIGSLILILAIITVSIYFCLN